MDDVFYNKEQNIFFRIYYINKKKFVESWKTEKWMLFSIGLHFKKGMIKEVIDKIKNMIKKKWNRDAEEKNIGLEELKQLQNEGAIIIDVRSPQEYREGHIDGAISIPEYKIKKEVENRIPDKNQNIVVYCSSGGRSKKAQKQLRKLGYSQVYNLYNGLTNYWDFCEFMIKWQVTKYRWRKHG